MQRATTDDDDELVDVMFDAARYRYGASLDTEAQREAVSHDRVAVPTTKIREHAASRQARS
ncbi:MAG: hypothetical protein KDA92_22180 [Planctomycetales bacterium]|nr:hypothetical protein [Planctomycetales bacterium]